MKNNSIRVFISNSLAKYTQDYNKNISSVMKLVIQSKKIKRAKTWDSEGNGWRRYNFVMLLDYIQIKISKKKWKKNEKYRWSNGSRKEMQKEHIPIVTWIWRKRYPLSITICVWYGSKFILFSEVDCTKKNYTSSLTPFQCVCFIT